MSEKKQNTQVGFKILKIQTSKFSFEDLGDNQINELFKSHERLAVDINNSVTINSEKTVLTIDVNSALIDKEKDLRVIEHTGRTAFEILGLAQFHNKETNAFDLPNELLFQLYTLAISHSRALLSIETSPTQYKDKYFLPVVDAKVFLGKLK